MGARGIAGISRLHGRERDRAQTRRRDRRAHLGKRLRKAGRRPAIAATAGAGRWRKRPREFVLRSGNQRTASSAECPRRPLSRNPKMALPLHTKVLLGFVLGTAAGIAAYAWARFGGELFAINIIVDYVARPAGALFLNLLFMLVLPLMFSALILGVAELGDIATLGRVGSRTLAYTAIVTAIAVGLGLLLVNLIQPGVAFDPALRESVMAGSSIRSHEIAGAHPALSGVDMLLGIVPRNVLRAAVEDQFLSVMFFALLLGVALVLTPSPATTAFKAAIQGLNELVMKLIGLVVRLTPYAVACLMFALSARFGWDLLLTLGRFVFTVLLAIALHMFVVLPLWVQFKGGMSPAFFFRGSQEAILTAFSTASSAGTLPTTLRVAEQNLRLPAHVARFVLTIGASANHHGTALFEGAHDAVPRPMLRRDTRPYPASLVAGAVHPGQHRHSRRSGRFATGHRDAARLPAGSAGCDRPDPRRRPPARHVPHGAERYRRSGHRRRRRAQRGVRPGGGRPRVLRLDLRTEASVACMLN
jgi:DAACS family dicarboxylate/amino acid:cation (Na+ or H+) symporter